MKKTNVYTEEFITLLYSNSRSADPREKQNDFDAEAEEVFVREAVLYSYLKRFWGATTS